jgi:hypothetical protein
MHADRMSTPHPPLSILALAVLAGCGARTGLEDGLVPLPDAGSVLPRVDAPIAPPCTGLCQHQVECGRGVTTELTGTVRAPSGVDPVYNAVVYVPNAPVAPFKPGLACEPCGAPVSGEPLVQTRSAPDGTFRLGNVPVGDNIPLVIQVGRWRRQIVIPSVVACSSTPVDVSLARLPRNQGEGDIPLMALVTGSADAFECALRRVGVDDIEFTASTQSGRIQVFMDNGANVPGILPSSQLGNSMLSYDTILEDCDGYTPEGPNGMQMPIVDYTSAGGRLITSHFGYGILENPPFASTLNLTNPPANGSFSATPGHVDGTTPADMAFLQWLEAANALTAPDAITIEQPKQDVDSVIAPAHAWITTDASSSVKATTQLYSFGMPLGQDPSQQCGEFVFSAFHVSDIVGPNTTFPAECVDEPMTGTEKAFEFMLFDVPTCAP